MDTILFEEYNIVIKINNQIFVYFICDVDSSRLFIYTDMRRI